MSLARYTRPVGKSIPRDSPPKWKREREGGREREIDRCRRFLLTPNAGNFGP